MPRFKLTIEYDGTPFVGWQRQENGPSVQGAIEEAASILDEREVAVTGAGRTDTGVHALGMVAHLDLQKHLPPEKVRDALNFHLRPNPVSVLSTEQVSDDFHARFSCNQRSYLYRLSSRRAPLALDKLRVWHVPYPLDAEAIREAARSFIGKHDFTTFRSSQCQSNSPVKTVSKVSVEEIDTEIHLHFAAPSFLHNQIRSFVGTLERVGAGKWPVDKVRQVLEARDRALCGPVAPARGLYFVRALYPD